MEDETSRKGSTLILGQPFLTTARTKMMCMLGHSRWNLFNIFEAMKHPTEDHSLFGIDLIDKLVEECLQLDNNSEDSEKFAGGTDSIGCLKSITEEADYGEVHDLSNSDDDYVDLANLSQEVELIELLDQHMVLSSTQVGQPDPKASNANSSSPPPPMELKSLSSHLKYAYLDVE
ncbi:hypothetical protein CR513_05736, partial [Mucuna pruriens]